MCVKGQGKPVRLNYGKKKQLYWPYFDLDFLPILKILGKKKIHQKITFKLFPGLGLQKTAMGKVMVYQMQKCDSSHDVPHVLIMLAIIAIAK